ncbi:MAG: hypothetical protein IJ312_05925 [Treponema sp.]|nr:hypothetical protein [Treponema sp.]
MKKKFLSVLCASALTFALISCATTSVKKTGIKGNAATIKKNYIQILDYQGASFGSEIPLWVVEIGSGNYSSEYLKSIMPGIAGKKVFVTVARGDNLAFTQQWTDLVDIEVQVGDEIQRVVGKAVSASQKGRAKQTGDAKDSTVLEQELNMYKQAVSAVELNGLEKIASYWIQKEVKPTKNSKESKIYYEYYAIWGMKEGFYNSQIKNAMDNIDDNTDEGRALKSALSKKLRNIMITSNDETLNKEVEETF